MIDLIDFISVPKMTSHYRKRYAKHARTVAQELNDRALLRLANEALDKEKILRKAANEFRAQRQQGKKADPRSVGLAQLDPVADTLIVALRDTLLAAVAGLEGTDPLVVRAHQRAAKWFEKDIRALINQSYENQCEDMEDILEMMEGPDAADVQDFGLTNLVARLKKVTVEYRRLVDLPKQVQVTGKDILHLQSIAHRVLLRMVVHCLAKADEDTPEHAELRKTFLAPLTQEMDKYRAKNRRTRTDNSVEELTDLDDAPEEPDEPNEGGPAA